jgi:hypothetical protein
VLPGTGYVSFAPDKWKVGALTFVEDRAPDDRTYGNNAAI